MTLSVEDQALARKLQPLIATGRFDPPWVRELAAVVHEPEERVRAVLRKQVTQGGVYQVVHDLFYDAERIGELAALVHALTQQHGAVSASQYRDAVGLGRKRTIQILRVLRSRGLHAPRPGFARRASRQRLARFELTHGRQTHPAVRLGFKPRRGRQSLPGRFDSCCLPPFHAECSRE